MVWFTRKGTSLSLFVAHRHFIGYMGGFLPPTAEEQLLGVVSELAGKLEGQGGGGICLSDAEK